jgi:hypothetical protein
VKSWVDEKKKKKKAIGQSDACPTHQGNGQAESGWVRESVEFR